MPSTPASIILVYSDIGGAETCVAEMRDDPANYRRVEMVERTVRAFGATSTVYVVAAWYAKEIG